MMAGEAIELSVELLQRGHQNQEMAAGGQCVGQIGDRPIVVVDVLDDVAAYDRIDACPAKSAI